MEVDFMKKVSILIIMILLFTSCDIKNPLNILKNKREKTNAEKSVMAEIDGSIIYASIGSENKISVINGEEKREGVIYRHEFLKPSFVDGSILFYLDDDENTGIYSLDVYSGETRIIMKDYILKNNPVSSPDGSKTIIKASLRDKNNFKIFLLIKNSLTPEEIEIKGFDIKNISFIDDDNIIYSKKINEGKKIIYQIYRYSISEKKEERVLRSNNNDINPIASPDGKKIVFLSDAYVDYNLFMMDMDLNKVENADIDNAVVGDSISWSKDGKYVVYITLRGAANYYIKTLNVEDKSKNLLGNGYIVSISPCSQYVVYADYNENMGMQTIYKKKINGDKNKNNDLEKISEFSEKSKYSRGIKMLYWIK